MLRVQGPALPFHRQPKKERDLEAYEPTPSLKKPIARKPSEDCLDDVRVPNPGFLEVGTAGSPVDAEI